MRKAHIPSHLELRFKTYFAVLYVPKDVRFILGKTKFSKSTKTGNVNTAQKIASIFVIGWKAEISRARHEAPDPLIAEALNLRAYFQQYGMNHADVKNVIDDRVFEISTGINSYIAEDFKLIATGEKRELSSLIPEWRKYEISRKLALKTIDQMTSDIGYLTGSFQTTNLLTPKNSLIWIRDFANRNNISASSVTRIISACKNFYKYLKLIEEVPEDSSDPFSVPIEFRKSKNLKAKDNNKIVSWLPFEEIEVVSLYKEALNKQDKILAHLIFIGAYTGARIEEMCSLKCNMITLKNLSLKIVDAKTLAGNRIIPIHSKLEHLIRELIKESIDGYLLSGLTYNKYQNRSNAIGKRFGRLKTTIGFGRDYVFHSIRKTLTTKLENAGVTENIAADIVGHDRPNLTYSTYSGGTSLEVKRIAIEKISYNFPE